MKKMPFFACLILSVMTAYWAGGWRAGQPAAASAASTRRILYYHDPMHPAYKAPKPGIAPDCGMQLEPVYAGTSSRGREPDPDGVEPADFLQINAGKLQIMGVETAAVKKGPVVETIRTLGRVAVDETRVVCVSAADGWVESIDPISTGTLVHKGDLLATIYSKEFQAAQLAFFYALGSLDKLPQDTPAYSGAVSRVTVAEKELRSLGMSDHQISEITRTRKLVLDVDLRSPITGFMLVRNAVTGMRYTRGSELFRIADLSRVWIVAGIFENQARYFKPGIKAKVVLPAEGRILNATVSETLPEFEPSTRTLELRLESDNPGYRLRPEMFVDVELPVQLPAALTVPSDAVLDSGLRKTVFVDLGGGRFEPRIVDAGMQLGNQTEILKGLAEGERVAVSGNFLLDSESRLKGAVSRKGDNRVRDPACGMSVDTLSSASSSVYHGVTYYFCSPLCRSKFIQDPARYAACTFNGSKSSGR